MLVGGWVSKRVQLRVSVGRIDSGSYCRRVRDLRSLGEHVCEKHSEVGWGRG